MKRLAIVTSLLLSAFCYVQAQRVFKIWEGVKNWETKDRLSATEIAVYPAKGDRISDKSIIICPGGGYYFLGLGIEGHEVATYFSERGFNCFVLRYRVGAFGNKNPSMIRDLQRAIQIVRRNHEDYGVTIDKLGVLGFSAGGHMAAQAAEYFDSNYMAPLGVSPKTTLRPDFIAMIYPVISMQDSMCNKTVRNHFLGEKTKDKNLLRRLSVELNTRPDMPPVFVAHCKDDETVRYRNAQMFVDSCRAKGVDVRFYLYNNGDHAFGLRPEGKNPDSRMWPEHFTQWLEELDLNGNADSRGN